MPKERKRYAARNPRSDRCRQRIDWSELVSGPCGCPVFCTVIAASMHRLWLFVHRRRRDLAVDLAVLEAGGSGGGDDTVSGPASTDPRRGRDACKPPTSHD